MYVLIIEYLILNVYVVHCILYTEIISVPLKWGQININ